MDSLVNNHVVDLPIAEEKDMFQRLPDHIIVHHMFDKMPEAKFLCWCSLVSKRFSSLVFQTTVVSCKFPIFAHSNQKIQNPVMGPLSLPQKFLLFISKPFRFIQGMLHSTKQDYLLDKDTRSSDLASIFLKKFTGLKYLYLELDYSAITFQDEKLLFKWKLDSKSSTFILLLAKGPDFAAAEVNNLLVVHQADMLEEDAVRYSTFFNFYLSIPFNWLSLLEVFIPLWSKELEHVAVTDSKKQGMIVVDQSKLAKMRNPDPSEEQRIKKAKLGLWHAPLLQLPSSGCIMKCALLCIVRHGDEVPSDDYLIAKEAFQGEDKIYTEAAIQLLKMCDSAETVKENN